MRRIWTDAPTAPGRRSGWLLIATLGLGGCATHQQALLSHNDDTMLDIWQRAAVFADSGGGAERTLQQARLILRRPLTDTEHQQTTAAQTSYTRTAATEIQQQFPRLPNPDLVLYVFPHLAGTEAVPVPGYSTVFPFYRQVQYALPGERLEDY